MKKIQSLVNFTQAPSPKQLCSMKTIKKDVVIPSKTTLSVKCRANTGLVEWGMPVLFEPSTEQSWPSGLQIKEELLTIPSGSSCRVQINVLNTINHDIRLNKRTVLGTLQLVKPVTPQEVCLKDDVDRCETHINSVHTNPEEDHTTIQGEMQASGTSITRNKNDYNPIDDLDLTGLTTEQQIKVQTMVEEEKESFPKFDDDIGCIEELELKLHMKDHSPVQKTCNSIPHLLYPEVKQHIEDLLNHGWITKPKSPIFIPCCLRS